MLQTMKTPIPMQEANAPASGVAEERAGRIKLGDSRVQRSRAAVLDAAVALLFERGYAGTSVDEIARRSGVAKTTIYRHWPGRTDLLREACSTIGTPLTPPDTGSLKGDVTALLNELVALLRSAKWTAVLPSIIDAAERDPAIAAMYATLQAGYSAGLGDVLERGIDRRELPTNTDVAVLVALLTGPFFYRRWFSREDLSDAFTAQVIERVLAGL
jgi:AcrR family transcriptional regulator